MVRLIFILLVSFMGGCVSNYTADMEYRMRLLERRITLLEMDLDNFVDTCSDDVDSVNKQ